jgi:hypothetical protein
MRIPRALALTVVAGLLATLACPPASAMTPEQQKKEEEEAAREDDAARNKITDAFTKEASLRGRVALYVEPQDGILGVFTTADRAYFLKAENEKLASDLKKFEGKEVTLGGKIRNQGKYFIVQEIPAPEPPPPVFRDPFGL